MDWRQRIPFFCGACLGVAVGFAMGHLTVWRSEVRKSPSLQAIFTETPLGMSDLGGVESLPQVESEKPLPQSAPVPGGALVLNEPDFGEDPVHADAIVTLPMEGADIGPLDDGPPIADAPQPLQVAGAKPISPPEPIGKKAPATDGSSPTDDTAEPVNRTLDPIVVELLGDDLKGVTEQQLEVWADALHGLPPGDAAGIIRMWKNFGESSANPRGTMSPFPTLSPQVLPQPAAMSKSLIPASEDRRLTKSEEWMQRITRHNAGNAETCGYLNLIPVMQELPLNDSPGGAAAVVGYRLDVMPGRYVKTGNPSHVAVQRQSFFVVRASTGEEWYTRVGRLVLDGERRLCIDLGDEDLPLVPEIKLPDSVTRFSFLGDSVQAQVPGRADPQSIGQLKVAEFFDSSRLEPKGRCLYAATTASGKASLVPAELIQETLEYPARVDAQGQRASRE